MARQADGAPAGRLVSLDALRGFDMFWLIGFKATLLRVFWLSDAPLARSLERQLEHPPWHGFTLWDLVFPLFLFIVGAALPFAMGRRLEQKSSKRSLYLHVAKRTLTLLLLGLIYNGLFAFDFAGLRYAGVLQRIGLCYFFASVALIHLGIRGQAVTTGLILVGYWLLMTLVPVPGFGAGQLTPEGNLAGYVDRLLLPGSFCCYPFGDQEGLLSTLPAIATTLLGVLAGHWLRSRRSARRKGLGLLLAGLAALAGGLAWGLVFPINKPLWTSSYVLYSGGWSLLLLALFYWVIDVLQWRRWAFPFVVIGMNAVTIYVLQELFDFRLIYYPLLGWLADSLGEWQRVYQAVCVFGLKWLLLFVLYKRRIFLKA